MQATNEVDSAIRAIQVAPRENIQGMDDVAEVLLRFTELTKVPVFITS